MDKYDILEAMSGIRDEYIEDAAVPSPDRSQTEHPGKEGKAAAGRAKILRLRRWGTAAAAVLCAAVISVTFRSSQFIRSAKDPGMAETGVGTMSDEQVTVEEETAAAGGKNSAPSVMTEGSAAPAGEDAGQHFREDSAAPSEDYSAQKQDDSDLSALTAMRDAGVTGPVEKKAEEVAKVFENALAEETGYSSLRFTHEVTTNSEDWVSLRMHAFTCAADGFEQVTHFNIRRDNSEYVTLETLFGEDTDYITPLSEEVIRQMRERMQQDSEAAFWLDSPEGPEYDFRQISPAQDFYFDSDGNLVLCFDEGEAAPTYMGTVEFTIPRSLTGQLLNNSGALTDH